MAKVVGFLLAIQLLFKTFTASKASTHWIVTETGRLQAQVDSMFLMRRPHDLIALLRQEERSVMLDDLKKELLTRKEEIDKNEDKDTGLEHRFYKLDQDCLAAGKPLTEFDLYISTVLPLENKGIRPEEHIDLKSTPTSRTAQPDCKLLPLDFSMHAFEHLEGMKDRQNLAGTPETGLKNAITHRENVEDYGFFVKEALKKNSTSWVLHNMAAFYWRIKGDSYSAIECLRRALHFSPRHQKDVALISLANVLHRERYSNEAAIVVHAALDVSKELNVNHFTLGNIYAVLSDYNKSVICFENTLKIQPEFEAARKRKHAVLCHAKLELALEAQHKSLQRTLEELKEYQSKHEYWQLQHEILLSEQALPDVKLGMRARYEEHKIREASLNIGERCHLVETEGRHVIQCIWGKATTPEIEALSNSNAWKEPEKPAVKRNLSLTPGIDYFQPLTPPLFVKRRPPPLEAPPHKEKLWPPKEECDAHVLSFPAWNHFPTTYLTPVNKGFEVQSLLTAAQGLKPGQEHPLPWYPPFSL